MTGPYESQLAEIAHAPHWDIPNIDQLGEALATLNKNLAALAEYPGGTGNWAKTASDSFITLQDEYKDFNRHTLLPIRGAITMANEAKEVARDAYTNLPGVSVPRAISEAVALGVPMLVPVLGPVPLAAALVIGLFESALGNQREDQAKAALAALHRDLKNPTDDLAMHAPSASGAGVVGGGGEIPGLFPDPDTTTGGSVSGTGHYSPSHFGYPAATAGTGAGNVEAGTGLSGSNGGSTAGSTIGYPSSGGSGAAGYGSTSADGDLSGGTVPGTGFNGGIGLAGSGGGLGGEGLRGLGIGAGSAASAAAVAAAARMGGLGNLGSGSLGGGGLGGGGLGGGTGGGLRVGGLGAAAGKGGSGGTGGLLGSGAKATVAASSGEEGAGGAAGSKSSNSMMGGQGGQGGTNKEKRSGLGGFIAPKLEDDEELGPRSAGASAGGRDAARE